MKRRLLRHPDSPLSPVTVVEADAVRLGDGRVSFVFTAIGETGRVRIPEVQEPKRADELWRHTCFEAFVAPMGAGSYYEFNFSPSRAWAAYRFDRYRSGMAKAEVEAPDVKPMVAGPAFGLVATIDLAPLPELLPWENWRVGVSAIVETEEGSRSYWALAHPPGKADFHHADCFAGELAPAATL